MSTTIETIYQGKYKSETKSPLNSEAITTDAGSFSPVALLISAYGSCLLGTMDYAARQSQFEITDAKTQIDFEMNEDRTKVSKINIKALFGNDYSDEQKQVIEFAAKNYCHVGKSIDPAIERVFEFVYNQK
ncbi:OsmC family protein [Olivibacter sp. SDN3]|uniref:OsmC family protein n=1 Tax=Olivibacter sp. SDN3 TaxID=2764720 RepID=UPI0016510C2C|nr:OsmC family protein [Olivibacter sp. SDN3]QNL52209.1 OsmC family protein [Olivibacter sp. SDN3]